MENAITVAEDRNNFTTGSNPKKMLRFMLPIFGSLALQEFLTQISFMFLCAFVNRLGLTASPGYGVASKIVFFVMLVPSSLMQSMSSFISQNVGAKREDRARKAMVFGMLFAFAIGVCINLIYFIIFSRQLKNNNTSG